MTTTERTLTFNEQTNLIEIKGNVLQAKKLRLTTGLEGFDVPDTYGIFKHTGGKALGIVGKVFEPTNLQNFLDAIEYSVKHSGANLDLSKLTYHEYQNGAKVLFRIPLKKFEIQSPMKGDVLETSLEFRTGFDGMTKISLGFFSLRLWCSNGAKNWQKDVDVSMKNTANNQHKLLAMTNEIIKVSQMTENHVLLLNEAVKVKVTDKNVQDFICKLLGFKPAELNEISTRKRNIFDAINASAAIEMSNTGKNLFSLLQGVTRYTTHDLAKNDEEALLYNRAAVINREAHQLVFAQLN